MVFVGAPVGDDEWVAEELRFIFGKLVSWLPALARMRDAGRLQVATQARTTTTVRPAPVRLSTGARRGLERSMSLARAATRSRRSDHGRWRVAASRQLEGDSDESHSQVRLGICATHMTDVLVAHVFSSCK